jgi:hypothetical protein
MEAGASISPIKLDELGFAWISLDRGQLKASTPHKQSPFNLHTSSFNLCLINLDLVGLPWIRLDLPSLHRPLLSVPICPIRGLKPPFFDILIPLTEAGR